MKSTITGVAPVSEAVPAPFVPELRQSTHEQSRGLVVLFTDAASGVVVHGDAGLSVGSFRTDWLPSTFEPFTGTVELAN